MLIFVFLFCGSQGLVAAVNDESAYVSAAAGLLFGMLAYKVRPLAHTPTPLPLTSPRSPIYFKFHRPRPEMLLKCYMVVFFIFFLTKFGFLL